MSVNNDNLEAVQVPQEALNAPAANAWLEDLVGEVFHAHVNADLNANTNAEIGQQLSEEGLAHRAKKHREE